MVGWGGMRHTELLQFVQLCSSCQEFNGQCAVLSSLQ